MRWSCATRAAHQPCFRFQAPPKKKNVCVYVVVSETGRRRRRKRRTERRRRGVWSVGFGGNGWPPRKRHQRRAGGARIAASKALSSGARKGGAFFLPATARDLSSLRPPPFPRPRYLLLESCACGSLHTYRMQSGRTRLEYTIASLTQGRQPRAYYELPISKIFQLP